MLFKIDSFIPQPVSDTVNYIISKSFSKMVTVTFPNTVNFNAFPIKLIKIYYNLLSSELISKSLSNLLSSISFTFCSFPISFIYIRLNV